LPSEIGERLGVVARGGRRVGRQPRVEVLLNESITTRFDGTRLGAEASGTPVGCGAKLASAPSSGPAVAGGLHVHAVDERVVLDEIGVVEDLAVGVADQVAVRRERRDARVGERIGGRGALDLDLVRRDQLIADLREGAPGA